MGFPFTHMLYFFNLHFCNAQNVCLACLYVPITKYCPKASFPRHYWRPSWWPSWISEEVYKRGGEQGGKSPFSLLLEPISPSSLLFPPISPSFQLFLGHFSLLPILFLPPLYNGQSPLIWTPNGVFFSQSIKNVIFNLLIN